MQTFLTLSPEQQNTAVSLGFFDGLHRGHRRVLSLAASQAQNGL
ncbi:MAG: riboflavin biosynthesis protein RibF, partial [Ruminococcus sp.]|nr:riboflavin biosynthesis protein RibF [Ruminococcus sp.]